MDSKAHTVTISGKEYLEYLELKEKNNVYIYNHQKQIEWYREKLKKEKEDRTITVRLEINKQRSSYREARDLTSCNVYVHSLDSVRQTKFLKEKIIELIHPYKDENFKLKDKIKSLEYNLEIFKSEHKKEKAKFESLNWFQRLFYNKNSNRKQDGTEIY